MPAPSSGVIAHYYAFLVAQLAVLPQLLSDPLGLHRNLLQQNTSELAVPLNMTLLWHTQVVVILVGHVLGVALAHRAAVRTFHTKQKVVLSQLPLLLLMVGYTLVGLWILTLPVNG